MTATDKNKCSQKVSDGTFRGHQCRRWGVCIENGKWWCQQHRPSTVTAKGDARYAAFMDNQNKKRDDHERSVAELSALRRLRDAVGVFLDDSDVDEIGLREAYKQAKGASEHGETH